MGWFFVREWGRRIFKYSCRYSYINISILWSICDDINWMRGANFIFKNEVFEGEGGFKMKIIKLLTEIIKMFFSIHVSFITFIIIIIGNKMYPSLNPYVLISHFNTMFTYSLKRSKIINCGKHIKQTLSFMTRLHLLALTSQMI